MMPLIGCQTTVPSYNDHDGYHDYHDDDDHDDDDDQDDHDNHDALDWMLDNTALRCQFVPIAARPSFLIDTTHKHDA